MPAAVDGAMRLSRLRLAHRIKLAGVAGDLLAALWIERVGLQRPRDVVDVLGGFQDRVRRQNAFVDRTAAPLDPARVSAKLCLHRLDLSS